MYLGGGTPIQKACGFEDSLDDMYRYMMAACGPNPDEAKIARYVEESLGHFDWLVARDVPFDPTFCADTSMAPDGTEGLVYSGGEDAYPFNAIARPAPRGHLAKTKRSTGWLLMQHLAAAATGAGAAVLDRHAGRPPRGRRRPRRRRPGAALRRDGDAARPSRRRADSRRLRLQRRHAAPTLPAAGCGARSRWGPRATTAGASAWRRPSARPCATCTPARCRCPSPRRGRLIHGILVNGQGQRFINEDTYMGRVGQSALYEQDGEVYLIVDEASYEVNWMGLAASWVCETTAQLEVRDRPARRLAPDRPWSSTTATPPRGRTRSSTRPQAWVRPLVPPIGAVDLRIGPAPYAPFTLGGLETNVAGEVCDLTGAPIGGLFAAGRTTPGCAPSATPAASPSGTARCSAAWPARVPPRRPSEARSLACPALVGQGMRRADPG